MSDKSKSWASILGEPKGHTRRQRSQKAKLQETKTVVINGQEVEVKVYPEGKRREQSHMRVKGSKGDRRDGVKDYVQGDDGDEVVSERIISGPGVKVS